MEKRNTPSVKSPKRPSPPKTATASMLSAVVNKEKQDLNINDGGDDEDNSVDLQLQLGKFTENPSIHKDNRLPPPKKRKTTESSSSDHRWSEDSRTLVHDGYDWRKYGQKEILNSKYPRHYFRCTHRFDQGCLATKQVQRISEDPPLYRTTYFRRHTCNQSSLSSSISHLGQATDEHTQEQGMGIVFGKRSNGHTQQPSILIGFEQQPDEHTQQHNLAIYERIQQHNITHESSPLSSSFSYVPQPRGIVKHIQQPSMAHEFELQPSEGLVPDVIEEPTLHVNRLCLTRPFSPTSALKKQAHPVIRDFNTTTTDLAESGDVAHYMSEVGLSGNHGQSTQKRITPPPVEAAFPLSFEVAEGAKLEAERHSKFVHNTLDADADIDEFCCTLEKEFETLPQDMKPLTLHCSLFPANYEFEKDMLVQLWIAGDFLGNVHTKDLEDSGNSCFNYLLEKKFVLPSRFDHICGDLKYKMNPAVASVLQKVYSGAEYLVVEDWKLDNVSERLQHLSLVCGDLKVEIFDSLKKCSRLQTLLLLSHSSSTIQQVPRSFFLRLRSLESLDLRRTNISELPDSIGNVISLRYIDLSETLIRWLPESFDRLCNLQTLKLKNCFDLVGLPNGMRKLKNLRHLILDNAYKIVSMPSGMGSLTNLRTLSAFIVGGHYGCSIEELKNLNHLYGKFHILRLENVSNSAEAREVALSDKKNIEKLDLHWSDLVEKREEEEEVLRQLQPHFGLKEFKVWNYGGLKFPDWVSDSSFVDLVSITFFSCKVCQILPSIGELPSLRFLCMQKMDGITEINRQFCGISRRNYAFPKLEVFKITEMPGLKEWKELENGDFPCLNKLIIESCPELATFPLLSDFTSLKHLEVSSCSKLSFSPTEGVPPSLHVLLIRDCPVLKEHWKKGKSQDWDNISHDFSLWVDHQEILV